MLNIGIATEFWSVTEEKETDSDNHRLFTLVKNKSMENDRRGEKPKKQRVHGIDRQDLVDLKATIEATLTLMGTDR